MGQVEDNLVEQMLKDGVELPNKIANAPTLPLGMSLFYVAFQELGSCRAIGMSLGPIPWTAVKLYCDEYDIRGYQREDMHYMVGAMDAAYREHIDKESEKKNKKRL